MYKIPNAIQTNTLDSIKLKVRKLAKVVEDVNNCFERNDLVTIKVLLSNFSHSLSTSNVVNKSTHSESIVECNNILIAIESLHNYEPYYFTQYIVNDLNMIIEGYIQSEAMSWAKCM